MSFWPVSLDAFWCSSGKTNHRTCVPERVENLWTHSSVILVKRPVDLFVVVTSEDSKKVFGSVQALFLWRGGEG